MSEQETYTREELEAKPGLALRRICKARGMSSEDCSKMGFDGMMDWILEQQGDGGGGKKATQKAPPKASKKPEPETTEEPPARKAPPKIGGGRKAPPKEPPKAPPKGRTAPKEDEVEETGEVVGSELMNTLLEKLAALEAKIDTLGEVVDTNIGGLVEDMGELRADVYGVARRQKHFHAWMVAEGILTVDPPEDLDLEAIEEAIEEECSGNAEGGSDE